MVSLHGNRKAIKTFMEEVWEMAGVGGRGIVPIRGMESLISALFPNYSNALEEKVTTLIQLSTALSPNGFTYTINSKLAHKVCSDTSSVLRAENIT